MDNPLKTVGGEAAVRLLWRLGTTEDRNWIESVVPAEVLDTWTRDRVRVKAVFGSDVKVKDMGASLRTAVLDWIIAQKSMGLTSWSGKPADLLTELKFEGRVASGAATLGRILSRWPRDHQIQLAFQREIAEVSGNPRVWTLTFP